MENVTKLNNVNTYLDNMSLGIKDKLFFLKNNKIKFDIIVDFGCADGFLLNEISKIDNNIKLIGYDLDSNMLKIASRKYPHIDFTNNWDNVLNIIKSFENKKALLYFSSVIHEVYSYSNNKEIDYFWSNMLNNKIFKYVAIRDMGFDDKILEESVSDNIIKNIYDKIEPYYLETFIDKWGDLNNNKNILHFLLKYRYEENWDREVKENYLPISFSKLISNIKGNIIHKEIFTLPFIKDVIKKDFNYDLNMKTHIKIIIEN